MKGHIFSLLRPLGSAVARTSSVGLGLTGVSLLSLTARRFCPDYDGVVHLERYGSSPSNPTGLNEWADAVLAPISAATFIVLRSPTE